MPRTTLTPQLVTRVGLTPLLVAADQPNGHQFQNTGAELLHIKTTTTGTTVTILTPGTVDGLAVADLAVVLGTSTERLIGPFPPGIYNQPDNNVYVDLTVGTGVTIGVYRGAGGGS